MKWTTIVVMVCVPWHAFADASTLAAQQREAPDDSDEKLAFKPISLKCPIQNGGKIELVRKSNQGHIIKFEGAYNGSVLSYMIVRSAYSETKPFVSKIEGVPNSMASSDYEISVINGASKQVQKLKDVVCDSVDPSTRSRYEQFLEKNRNLYRNVEGGYVTP